MYTLKITDKYESNNIDKFDNKSFLDNRLPGSLFIGRNNQLNIRQVQTNPKSKKTRVNINVLLTKVRNEKNKEKKENYIFLGLICGLVVVTGIIASLWNYIKL